MKFEALRPLFDKKQKLFVHADIARQILVAVDFSKKFNIDVVLVGGSDSYLFADLLRQNNIAVILNSLHSLPTMQDDDIDQPFKTPAILQKAGCCSLLMTILIMHVTVTWILMQVQRRDLVLPGAGACRYHHQPR
ncbi:hypothetical protein LWM68_24700 [Niabella sp. W65]|nr:hypothetical protein [Niabella sp. W65]MCH7365690.1 hypothetical protein [Niabella sp. W65]ULT41457.1 hypothetical protein KRR40_43610 [Niabella sp. I65]